ncbi:TPA: hypothetical protein ACS73S_003208, partial [Providencia alcalifaciens]
MKITYIASTLMRAIQNNTGNLSRNTTRLSQSLLSVRNVNTQNSVRPSSFTLLSSISGPQSSQIPPAPPLPNSISGPQSSQIPPAPPLPNSKDKIPGTESLLDNLKGVSGKSHGTNNGPSYMDELKSVLSKRNSYADTTDASTSSSTETLTQASSRSPNKPG